MTSEQGKAMRPGMKEAKHDGLHNYTGIERLVRSPNPRRLFTVPGANRR